MRKGKNTTTYTKEYGLTKEECEALNYIQDEGRHQMMIYIAEKVAPQLKGVDLSKNTYQFKYLRKEEKLLVKQIVQNLNLDQENFQDIRGWKLDQ